MLSARDRLGSAFWGSPENLPKSSQQRCLISAAVHKMRRSFSKSDSFKALQMVSKAGGGMSSVSISGTTDKRGFISNLGSNIFSICCCKRNISWLKYRLLNSCQFIVFFRYTAISFASRLSKLSLFVET